MRAIVSAGSTGARDVYKRQACERATDLACTVREYMTLLEQAPPLQAQSLTGDYRLLADFNGAVLAAHPTRLGVQFVTWDWSCLLYTSRCV